MLPGGGGQKVGKMPEQVSQRITSNTTSYAFQISFCKAKRDHISPFYDKMLAFVISLVLAACHSCFLLL